MATIFGKKRTKREILSYIANHQQLAGARPCVLRDGKADGVKALSLRTGGGLDLTILPGRAMDIAEAFFRGRPLHFLSNTGIVSPAYYDEPGLSWLRNFFAGLLTTCGISYSGAPNLDEGTPLGLHGRISNTSAEDVGIDQAWDGDEFRISVRGTSLEASAMGETLALTRTIETYLGAKSFRIHDVIENRGFEPQPLMMLYHFNFGYPLLGPSARVVGPITNTEPRNEAACADRGVEECLSFPQPQKGFEEKVFFHTLAQNSEGRTFIALLNRDIGDGTPLGIVMRFSQKELPAFTEWKMSKEGFYVVGLEPGTTTPAGRAEIRKSGTLPFIEGQESYPITIDLEVIDSLAEMDSIERESRALG